MLSAPSQIIKIETDLTNEIIDTQPNQMSTIEKEMIYCVLDKIVRNVNKRDYQKKFQCITIHSIDAHTLNDFICKVDKVFSKWKLNLFIENVEYKYLKDYNKDYSEECYWENMCEFKLDEDYMGCPFIKLLIQKCNKHKHKQFLKDLNNATQLKFTESSNTTWFPNRPTIINKSKDMYYITKERILPKYPIYIISKGRWEERLTSKYLEWSDIPYKIVIEESEYEQYSKVIDKSKILIMPNEWKQKEIEKGNGGGIPVRNFVLHHSKNNGDKRHWILDDNIVSYKRYNNNTRTIMRTGLAFRMLEDFTDRFKNVMLSGHNYSMFGVSTNTRLKPITMNSRIYSSILINNDIPFQWRGVYNEDTDLSLRVLKSGFPTLLFNCFLCDKEKTMSNKGGNTDTIYAVENYSFLKSNSLKEQHSDVCKLTNKYGRVHHQVNYNSFKDLEPIYVDNVVIEENDNDFGLVLDNKSNYPQLLRREN
jgi:hypothetical protein